VKTLVVTKDKRVIVKISQEQTNSASSGKKSKGTLVTCPCCNAQFPYSLIAKQISCKPKFDRNIILKIIKDESPTTTRVVAREYFAQTGYALSTRNLQYILKGLKNQGSITTKVFSNGRYGRSTRITFLKKKESC
jgi:hypothetical protein